MSSEANVDVDDRRRQAIAGARAAIAALGGLGVRALITGSLAKGCFGIYSDVDLLITDCPRDLKYAIEGVIEDALGGLPFDVVYLDEVAPWRVRSFTDSAVDASELR